MARPSFFAVYGVVDGVPIAGHAWKCLFEKCVVFSKPPRVYYFYYEEGKVLSCLNLWYIYRIKEICCCLWTKDFTIHIIPI